jgi:hypothetical protein
MFLPVECVELKKPCSMELLIEPWQALAAEAAEPNPFYEPWALLPALEHLAGRGAPSVLFVWRDQQKSDLIGVFPLERAFGYHHLPVVYRGLWQHVHCFLTTPLLKRGAEQEGWRGFLEWAGQQTPLIHLAGLAADGPVYRGLSQALLEARRRHHLESRILRPLLAPTVSAAEYLDAALRKKRRRQFDRKRELLSEHGAVRFETATDCEVLAQWLVEFIELEARGWKGRGQTAIKSHHNEMAYFRSLVRRGGGRGKLRAYRLLSGDATVAMRFDLVANNAAFALKIAYDEAHAEYSPGGLLEIEILQRFFKQGELAFIDSCTIPSPNSIHGYFWRESRAICSLDIASPSVLGESLLGFGRWIRLLKAPRVGVPQSAGSVEAIP